MERRRFLLQSAALPALAWGRDTPARVLAQCYIWVQDTKKRGQTVVDTQDEFFGMCRDAGYREIELMREYFVGEARERTLRALRRAEMTAPIVYLGGAMHDEAGAAKAMADAMELARAARDAGCVAINTNPNPKPGKKPKTDAELKVQAAGLNRLGEALARQKMRLFVHHHDPEMADNAREWRHILKNTDPSTVDLCIDTHWVLRGKQDPLAILKEAGKRVASLHIRNSRGGVWSEAVGEGEVDYPAIAKWLKSSKQKPYLVAELAYESATQITRPLGENLKLSREYVEKTFLR